MASSPLNVTAASITVSQTLELLDSRFPEFAQAVGQGRYACWLGSGISRERVDDLRRVIRRVLAHLRDRIDGSATACRFRAALDEILVFAQLSDAEKALIDFAEPIDVWPCLDIVLQRLIGSYARLLDVRVDGEVQDYLLWDAVDVCNTFANPKAEPDCEHLCIGVLILEGALGELASANWDGLIEVGLAELSASHASTLRVCVRAEDMREAPLRARLLKFHGCAVKARQDPGTYRSLLVGRLSQITQWPFDSSSSAMRKQLVNLAVTKQTLMIGLSAQDTNIQHVFAEAKSTMPWPWPCHPPAYVFAEDALGPDQRNLLKCVYPAAYDANGSAIDVSAQIRAFGKPLLLALMLHVVGAKLGAYIQVAAAPNLTAHDRSKLALGIGFVRNQAAASATSSALTFVRRFVHAIARTLSLFQDGRLLGDTDLTYRALNALPVHQISSDPNLTTSGLSELAVALGVLGRGCDSGAWSVALPQLPDLRPSALILTPVGSNPARVVFVANNAAVVRLQMDGLISRNASDIIMIHSTPPARRMARSPNCAPGRTGRPAIREVSMTDLLRDSKDLDELQRRFREEAAA